MRISDWSSDVCSSDLFSAAFPHLVWQPSDPAAAHRRSIEGYRRAAGGANLRAPLDIDVTASAWPLEGPVDAMVCCNMIHIAPWAAAEGLLAGAARYLRPGGGLYLDRKSTRLNSSP